MRYVATADTDIGTTKNTNQDSILIKHAVTRAGQEVLMAIVCDGMGGLAKGELASATVIQAFSRWFDEELPYEIGHGDMRVIGAKWSILLKDLNVKIQGYSEKLGESLGTTFSGILMTGNVYVSAHVGDSRVYQISSGMNQLTTDQTFVAREVRRGNMTPEQAKKDKRRSLLLQCVGASKRMEPEILCGETQKGAYMICSDGFRHEITADEMYESLNPVNFVSKASMHSNAKYLIELVKSRRERDNISVVLIKVD